MKYLYLFIFLIFIGCNSKTVISLKSYECSLNISKRDFDKKTIKNEDFDAVILINNHQEELFFTPNIIDLYPIMDDSTYNQEIHKFSLLGKDEIEGIYNEKYWKQIRNNDYSSFGYQKVLLENKIKFDSILNQITCKKIRW